MGTLRFLMRGLMLGLVFALLPLTLLGAPMSVSASPGPQELQDALHEVLPGDNLHLIAGYYYGDCRQWERIWKANRDPIPNPNRLTRGMVLRIPDVTVPDEAYTDFVARTQRPSVPAGAPSSTPEKP